MSIESVAQTALSAILPSKVYSDLNDQGTSAPYIVHQRAGGAAPAYLENAVPSKDTARLQITAWHSTRVSSQALGEQVLTALVALGWRPLGAAVALYDEKTKLRGHAQDFAAFADR